MGNTDSDGERVVSGVILRMLPLEKREPLAVMLFSLPLDILQILDFWMAWWNATQIMPDTSRLLDRVLEHLFLVFMLPEMLLTLFTVKLLHLPEVELQQPWTRKEILVRKGWETRKPK